MPQLCTHAAEESVMLWFAAPPVAPGPAEDTFETIDVARLRVGMFVRLDVGWMNHPFPVSQFRLASPAQIDVLRATGLQQVRWSPALSAPGVAPLPAAVTSLPEEPAQEPSAPTAALPPADEPLAPSPLTADAGPADLAPGAAELRRQRQVLAHCEQQHAEVTEALRGITRQVDAAPLQAGREAAALAGALVSKLHDAGDACVRLLSDVAVDDGSGHAVNVGVLSLMLGRALGCSRSELAELALGALLHDIGKLALPPQRWHAQAEASALEQSQYRSHVALGVAQARRMALPRRAKLVLAQHHERNDGQGFPMRTAGRRIDPLARMVAIANRFDNLCNGPWPARALTPHEALGRLFGEEAAAFERSLVEHFVRLVGVYPPGTAVQLSDDRFGLVVAVDPARPLRPRLLLHEPGRPAAEAAYTELAAQPRLSIRRSLRPEALPPEVRRDLAPGGRLRYFWEPVPAPADTTLTAGAL